MSLSVETLALARKYTDDAIIGATGIEFKIVQTLPSTGVSGGIYLVPNAYSVSNNVYDEYIYANNSWEKIGSTEVDLTQYRTASAQDLIDAGKVGSQSIDNIWVGTQVEYDAISPKLNTVLYLIKEAEP